MPKLINIIGNISTQTGEIIINSATDRKNAIVDIGTLKLEGSTSGTLSLKTGDITTDHMVKFPTNIGATGSALVLQDGQGNFVWQAGIAGAVPSTIAGLPYVLANDMPDVAANAYALLLGDFKRGYRIVDNNNVRIIRNAIAPAIDGTVEFTGSKRVGAQIVLPDAFLIGKIAV